MSTSSRSVGAVFLLRARPGFCFRAFCKFYKSCTITQVRQVSSVNTFQILWKFIEKINPPLDGLMRCILLSRTVSRPIRHESDGQSFTEDSYLPINKETSL
jgi:hypothetical protein